jgi:hypothetical protein
MASYDRVMRDGGTVILAEPGGAHEGAKVSVDAMEKYGILERGMELDDVAGYAEGTSFGPPEQLFLLRVAQAELGATLDNAFFKQHSAFDGNLFKLVKGAQRRPPAVGGVTRLVDGVKRRVKRQLHRF